MGGAGVVSGGFGVAAFAGEVGQCEVQPAGVVAALREGEVQVGVVAVAGRNQGHTERVVRVGVRPWVVERGLVGLGVERFGAFGAAEHEAWDVGCGDEADACNE